MDQQNPTTGAKFVANGVFADAEDDEYYGRVRDPNFHDWDYCNRRRRHRSLRARYGDGDDDCYDPGWDARAAVIRLRPILPSPFRELSYTPRTGWAYRPASRNAPGLDRLGTGIAELGLELGLGLDRDRDPSGSGRRRRSRTETARTEVEVQRSETEDLANANATPPGVPLLASGTRIPPLVANRQRETAAQNPRASETNAAAPPERKRGGIVDPGDDADADDSLPPRKRPRLIQPSVANANANANTDAASIVTQSTGDGSSVSASAKTMDPNAGRERIVSGDKASSAAAAVANPKSQSAPAAATAAASKSKSTSTSIPPKALLHQWYGKKPRRAHIGPEHYMVWDNGKTTQEQLFTAVFFCPMTGEAFLAGPWTGSGGTGAAATATATATAIATAATGANPDPDGLSWFPRKITAEHAAAARAWDCLVKRDPGSFDESLRRLRLGGPEPYWPSRRPAWPLHKLPKQVVDKLPQDQRSSGTAAAIATATATATPTETAIAAATATETAIATATASATAAATAGEKSNADSERTAVHDASSGAISTAGIGNKPEPKSTTNPTRSGGEGTNKSSSGGSSSNKKKRKANWGETGQGNARDADRHPTGRQPLWNENRNNTNRNNSSNSNNNNTNFDFKMNRDREQYRAMRMSQGRGPHSHGPRSHGPKTNQYPPQHRNQPPPIRTAQSNASTNEQMPPGTMQPPRQYVSQPIPGQNQNQNPYNNNVHEPQHPQQTQYQYQEYQYQYQNQHHEYQQQPTNQNPFQNASGMQHSYHHQQHQQQQQISQPYNQQQSNSTQYHSQQQFTQQQFNHQQQYSQPQFNQQQQYNQQQFIQQASVQPQPLPLPPPPPQPPPLGTSNNPHQAAWNNPQPNPYPHGSFGNNNATNRPPYC